MAPFPETAGLLALRGPAALHLTGWIVTAASLFLPLAVWDERRRSERLFDHWSGAAPQRFSDNRQEACEERGQPRSSTSTPRAPKSARPFGLSCVGRLLRRVPRRYGRIGVAPFLSFGTSQLNAAPLQWSNRL